MTGRRCDLREFSRAVMCVSSKCGSHEFPIDITSADIDFMGHVNNAVYLTWVQQAVLSHWKAIASPAELAAHRWVAVKHEITYRTSAFLDDRLIAKVQLQQVRRESAFYDVIIGRGDTVVAEIKSRWCCLDAVTSLPVRVQDATIKKFFR